MSHFPFPLLDFIDSEVVTDVALQPYFIGPRGGITDMCRLVLERAANRHFGLDSEGKGHKFRGRAA